ncbi:hypothetical protein AAFP30_00315 [Gordonia sp. CPCC 205515]|uniref:Rv0361 family membrane protein n=1 Tax=Gordonia sp. CPCC 205515 TaxID=3140791 RepID=UPI003AF34C6B
MTFPPPGQHFGPPPPMGGGAPGYPQGYPQQPYGMGYSPYPPPQPPRRPRTGGLIAAGVLGGVAIFAVVVLLGHLLGANSDPDTTASPDTMPTVTAPTPPGGDPSDANGTDVAGIQAAMQKFVDAVNSRNVPQIQAAVCTAVRPQVIKPVDITGNVVLEGLGKVTVTGNSAQSQVMTHLEVGAQRSTSKQEDESFTKENGTWFVCPGAEPDIGT